MPIKILVADDVSESGLEPLRSPSFQIEKRIDSTADELRAELSDSEGLVVRSATKVTAELMEGAKKLRVIGRAGVGVDNIDVPAATARGIVVMNAPDGNTITTAEHTIALMVSLARNVPQANSSLKSAKWERKKFIGAELQGKTLGIVGLGRIGRVGYDQRGFQADQLSREPRKTLTLAIGEARFDDQVLSFDITKLPHRLRKRLVKGFRVRRS